MNQASIANDGASPVTRVRLLLVSGLVLPLVCGLVFFWPERTIPNVDDLFFVPWAIEFAETGRHWNSLLALQFPRLESYHLQPRLHLILAGWFFGVAGAGTTALVLFEFLCYALASLVFVAICLNLNLRLAAVFTPLLLAPAYVIAGFRLELTGSILFLTGLLVSLPLLQSGGSDNGNRFRYRTGASILGKCLLAVAPLAAPAIFAWSLGAIAVIEISRLVTRQAGPVRIVVEGLAGLGVSALVFAVSTEFEFASFFEQFAYHASRSTGGGLNDEAIFRAALFAVAAGVLLRKTRAAAVLCASLAAGQLLAAFLHDKALIRNVAASMVFLIAVDAALAPRWAQAKAALFALLFVVLSLNLFSFYLLSEPAGNAKDVTAAYSRDLVEGRRVFIDETMAHHFLDQRTDGALAWTWGGTFPKGRPTSMDDLEEGDVWYVSEYTLLGYLKGRHDVARTVWPDPDYRRVPQIPCVFGRLACNLPQKRWTMMRMERTNGSVIVSETGWDKAPRVLDVQ